MAGAEELTPLVFAVIVGTVIIYGLGMAPIARSLGLAKRRQEGVLIIGAGRLERTIAAALVEQDFPVLLATTNRQDEYRARMAGLETHYGNVLVEDVDLELDLSGIGRVLSLTPNDDVNTLAVTRFVGIFGRAQTYQLAPGRVPAGVDSSATTHLAGRLLFGTDAGYEQLSKLMRRRSNDPQHVHHVRVHRCGFSGDQPGDRAPLCDQTQPAIGRRHQRKRGSLPGHRGR